MKHFEPEQFLKEEIEKCEKKIKSLHKSEESVLTHLEYLKKHSAADGSNINKDCELIKDYRIKITYCWDKIEFLNKILNLIC